MYRCKSVGSRLDENYIQLNMHLTFPDGQERTVTLPPSPYHSS
jgi:hypothetical protein